MTLKCSFKAAKKVAFFFVRSTDEPATLGENKYPRVCGFWLDFVVTFK